MKIAFVPRYGELLHNRLFESNEYSPLETYGVDRPAFSRLKSRLIDEGHQVGTIDQFSLGEVDIVVFVDINFHVLDELIGIDETPGLIYLMREPPTAVPFNRQKNLEQYLPVFNRILTWNDAFATVHDRAISYKLPYYISENRGDGNFDFESRKLLVNVSSRKRSSHPNELYSAREAIINYYDENHPDHFTLYGRNWNTFPSAMETLRGNFKVRKYKVYRGVIGDKFDAYHTHRFALAFENISDISGYISEKIFDCFKAGTVPVYWGAENVEEYIPEGAFIDYRELDSPEELHKQLRSVTSEEYKEYLQAASQFIKDPSPFLPKDFVDTIVGTLHSTPTESRYSISANLRERIRKKSHLDRLLYVPEDVPLTEYSIRTAQLLRTNPATLTRNPQVVYHGLSKLNPLTRLTH